MFRYRLTGPLIFLVPGKWCKRVVRNIADLRDPVTSQNYVVPAYPTDLIGYKWPNTLRRVFGTREQLPCLVSHTEFRDIQKQHSLLTQLKRPFPKSTCMLVRTKASLS